MKEFNTLRERGMEERESKNGPGRVQDNPEMLIWYPEERGVS